VRWIKRGGGDGGESVRSHQVGTHRPTAWPVDMRPALTFRECRSSDTGQHCHALVGSELSDSNFETLMCTENLSHRGDLEPVAGEMPAALAQQIFAEPATRAAAAGGRPARNRTPTISTTGSPALARLWGHPQSSLCLRTAVVDDVLECQIRWWWDAIPTMILHWPKMDDPWRVAS
jgi:hypothetical protein